MNTSTTGPEASFAQRLRAERKRMGLSQTQFMTYGGVQKGSQVNYENGWRKPDVAYLEGLYAHGVDVAYLLTGERTKQATPRATGGIHPCCSLRESVRQLVREEMAADAAQKAEEHRAQMDLRLEVKKRSDRARDAGVVEPSLLDLLTLPPDPPPYALMRAAGRHDLAEACASHPTAQARSEAGRQPPADQGASK